MERNNVDMQGVVEKITQQVRRAHATDHPKGVKADTGPPPVDGQGHEAPTPPAQTETVENAPDPGRAPDQLEKRISEMAKHKQATETENESLRKEMAELRQQLGESKKKQAFDDILSGDRPKGFDDWSSDRQQMWLTQKYMSATEMPDRVSDEDLSLLNALKVERKIAREAGEGFTPNQIAAAGEVMRENPGLNGLEAIGLAKLRNPDLFDGAGPTEAQPPRVQEQGLGGGRRAPSDPQAELRERLRAADTQTDRQAAAAQLIRQRLFGPPKS